MRIMPITCHDPALCYAPFKRAVECESAIDTGTYIRKWVKNGYINEWNRLLCELDMMLGVSVL